jgi:hypothetical protein
MGFRLSRRNGCATIVALLAALFIAFVVAATIGSHRLYEEEVCFDSNLTGKPMPNDEMKKLADQCAKDSHYRRAAAPSGSAGSMNKGVGMGASKNTAEDRVPHN